jgi:GNAT superfamily N-acetyltransferase
MSKAGLELKVDATPAAAGLVVAMLEERHRAAGFPSDSGRYCALLRDESGQVQGGVLAESAWGWVYVIGLVVKPAWQRRSYGARLLNAAEAWASERGCRNSWVTTYSFHSPGFYERLGYRRFAELPQCPASETLYFLKKAL